MGAPGTSGFWDIRLSEIGLGRALGPVEPELDCKSGQPGTEAPLSPSKLEFRIL